MLPAVLLIVCTGAAWSAKPKPKAAPKAPAVKYSVSMQAVGTFEDQKPAAKISMVMSPDEFEPGSFVVKASKAVSGLSVSVEGNLKSGKHSLAASQVRIARSKATGFCRSSRLTCGRVRVRDTG